MRARFQRNGPLALAAAAYGQEYEFVRPEPAAPEGGVAVVMIMGPLTHHGDWWGGDTYDAIESRVSAALATTADTVVLKIDSPGGEFNGMLECSRALRAMASQVSKRLVAYVDEFACSAAYALACAASEIYLPQSAYCGSVGVMDSLVDASVADQMAGVQVAIVTSGKRKADGNPHVQLTDEVRAVSQARVDAMAGLFFGLVAESRRIDVEAVRGMQAAIYRGEEAVAAKLADGVMSWDALIAHVTAAPVAASGEGIDVMKRAEVLAALKAAMAEGEPAPAPEKKDGEPDGDEMTSSQLKAAVKALLAEGEPAPAAPTPAPAPHKEPDGDEKKPEAPAAMVAVPVAVASVPIPAPAPAPVPAVTAEMERTRALAETAKAALIASRPDLNAKDLASESLETVMAVCRLAPKAVAPVPVNPAAAAMVQGTRGGEAQASTPTNDLAARMGLGRAEAKVTREGNHMVFPVLTPETAKARLAELEKGGSR